MNKFIKDVCEDTNNGKRLQPVEVIGWKWQQNGGK